jgi:methionyl-tRNA formyltransferase
MNVIFCGTPQFAVPSLKALVDAGFQVRLVVTQPDRPSGRGMTLAASPVKQRAIELGLPVTQPEKIKNNAAFRAQLEEIKPEAIVVVGYGRIIPQWMIDLAPLGNINLHASLLPKYRGAAPVQWAIAMGESVTGNTTMRIDAGLDTGDMLLQQQTPIAPEDTAETLGPRLAAMGAPLLVETLRGLESGTLKPQPQDNSRATLAPILKKEDGLIDFNRTAAEINHRLRGFYPWPGAFTRFRGKQLNFWKLEPSAINKLSAVSHQPSGNESVMHESLAPGEISTTGDRLYVGCGQNTMLEVLELQPEGKRRMSARDFVNGYRPGASEKFGEA